LSTKTILIKLKNIAAILLIILFAFSQYARQLSFLECKISNTFKFTTTKCDCEKQAGLDKKDTSPSPNSKTHNHIHLDEFFGVSKPVSINLSYRNLTILSGSISDDECEGVDPKPWQPPNTWSAYSNHV